MSIASLTLSNYIMVAELLGLWVMLGSNVHLSKRTITATRIVIILIFTEAICWGVERYTREIGYLTMTRIFLTPTIYLLHPIIMLGIMDMAEFVQKKRLLLYLPVLISAPLLYTSQWTHLFYWFDENNLYIAADSILQYYPYFLFMLYVLLFIVAFTVRYAKYGTVERRGILVSIFAAFIGVVLHLVFDIYADYSTLFASLLLIYYLSLYVLTAKEDTLTHLLNRQCYYSESKSLKDVVTAVVSVDMNDLKKINDTQGHDAGDRALKTVAECLTPNRLRNKKVYRIGGDEFAIFYLNKTEEEVVRDIEQMRAELAKTEYVCAFGYEMVEDKDVLGAMQLADREMYSNKAKLKDTNERRIAAHKEATIRVMHEALGSGMWGMEFDEEGKMTSVDWSPEFRRMIGFTDENDFPNKLESWSERLHPDDKDRVLKEFNDTISDYSGEKNYDVEYRFKVKDGEWRWFHAIGRLLRRDDGSPLSYVGMFVDITDQKAGRK
ncbi:PAS domain S-box-containing protein/diguanylate cyclase (GGDEF) domain-containing protein [Lachnospiraceae bacterium XBB2008]|nr:PAS domain S-box-containing protein/diguanylate cyclase (GGDEF) domain-containing protein [Lachnospiraceae bacterium XBB2008]